MASQARLDLPLTLTATDQVDRFVQSQGHRQVSIMRAREINGWVTITITSQVVPAARIADEIRARFL